MANITKIVFLGAGSVAFGLSMFKDLFSNRDLTGSTLTLVDTNAEALQAVRGLADLMNKRLGTGLKVEHTTDRRAAFDGAGFVVNAAAIDRNRLWRQDFEVPKKHGIRHTLGENGGPGGLFFSLRTLPMIFDFTRDMEELCPNALFINYSNPESRIVLALSKYSPIRAIGLCHGIFMAQGACAHIMGREYPDVEVWGAGLNHFQWLFSVRERATGKDLYPELKAKAPGFDPGFEPFSRKLLGLFGGWLTCSDDHLGEYLPYGWEAGEHGHDFAADERDRVELKETLDAVLAGRREPPEDWFRPSGERGVTVIESVLNNRKRYIESAVVYNQGTIPNLPPDLAVEVPIVADASGIHPVSLGPIPDPAAKLMLMQASVQQMAVEAAVRADKDLALQALLVDPVITSTDAAVKILDELWEINRPYIRKCI